jgi:hypothetical protein
MDEVGGEEAGGEQTVGRRGRATSIRSLTLSFNQNDGRDEDFVFRVLFSKHCEVVRHFFHLW